jgi:hypothetical protein
MTFDEWFEMPERGDEIAALVDFAREQAAGDADETEALLLYFAMRMGWENALRQQAPLRANFGPEGRPTLH